MSDLRDQVARLICSGPDKPACGQCLEGADEVLAAVFDELEVPSAAMLDEWPEERRGFYRDHVWRPALAAAREGAKKKP